MVLAHKPSALKHRVQAQRLAFGHARPVSDLFGACGRELLAGVEFPEPWPGGVLAAVAMIDDLDRGTPASTTGRASPVPPALHLAAGNRSGDRVGARLHDQPEIGDIERFSSPKKRLGYMGPCPSVYQPGRKYSRGHLSHAGPATCAWRWSRPACARAANAPSSAPANSAAPKSPRSFSPGR